MRLQDLVTRAAQTFPTQCAVHGADRTLTYGELDQLAGHLAFELLANEVRPQDRVLLWHDKSAAVVAAMQGVLRCGAAYIPADPTAPVARIEQLLVDSGAVAIATTEERYRKLQEKGYTLSFISLDASAVERRLATEKPAIAELPEAAPDALAYILYTSGSTGVPKGVSISHRNALAFVLWAVDYLALTAKDQLANHAPFHFDLSVLDLYGAFAAGATVHIVSETAAYVPKGLVSFVCERQISVWYSVPSALRLMVEQGGLGEAQHALRQVIFAGEVYPTRNLRALQQSLPGVSLHNFYGPTETNVCTAYCVPPLAEDDARPIPIGSAASGDVLEIRDEAGNLVAPGEMGELWVSGPTVMLGYWGKPAQTGPYRTGDLVSSTPDGVLSYYGRRDHQVKVRGHRIELGEIEAVLSQDPRLAEVAVIVEGSEMQAALVAYAVARGTPPSLIALKRVCAERLPRYMILDRVQFVPELPRTGNGKVDRKALKNLSLATERRETTL